MMTEYLPWILSVIILLLTIIATRQEREIKNTNALFDEAMAGYARALDGWGIASTASAAWKAKAKEQKEIIQFMGRVIQYWKANDNV